MENVHIGEAIKSKMQEQKMLPEQLATAICCSRQNVYDIFKRSTIDIDRLISISRTLNYDFYTELYLSHSAPTLPKRLLLIEVDNDKQQALQADGSIKVIADVSEKLTGLSGL
jgi:hypothetical protein